MAIQVVILAAGKGKRMYSDLPKVMHPIGGKPLLQHVIDKAHVLTTTHKPPIIIYGHQGERIRQAFSEQAVKWVEQKEQLGTGHALLQALPMIADDDQVLVLYGDVPLTSDETLNHLIQETPPHTLGMLTAYLSDPKGYGRIQRDPNTQKILKVIEEKDATEAERMITEINPGIYFLQAAQLKKWLPELKNKNAQQEYYLTDIIALAVQENIPIHAVQPKNPEEIFGVNDRLQLAYLERFYQRTQAEKWLRAGVTFYDPLRFDVRGDIDIGRDVTIDVNVLLEGRVVIDAGCVIGPNVILRNTELGMGVEIKANSVIDGANISAHSIIGPFARIRPGTKLAMHTHVGNFVEIKNSELGEGTKANHLSYVGDAIVGKHVNIGAGTITCNYDGANKHKTIIGDDVQIGSDTQLVAPVTVGDGATIAAGSTITKNVPPKQLTLTHRLEQRSHESWKRPAKIEKE